MTRVVLAAGGLVFRKTSKGNLRVLIAHRPKYDDWSLPKGKADEGETPEETAVREVLEETGQHCRIVAPVGTTRYRISRGVKEVNWYAMRVLPDSPGFRVNDEIDQIQWLSPKKARKVLDYDNDRELVGSSDLKKLSQTGSIYLLRHAVAGDRNKWMDDDRHRPLTKKGKRQAASIAETLKVAGIERIFSSPYIRCVETVKPLAKAIGAKVEISDAISEGPDIDAAYELIDGIAGYNSVVSSHGDVIAATINRLMWAGLSIDSRFYCSKGSIWKVEMDLGKFTKGHYTPPPKV